MIKPHPRYNLRRYKLPVFIIVLGLTGAILAKLALAAPSVISFEAENANNLSQCVSAINSASASGGKALEFGCPQQTGFIHPGVVYTQAEIDAWSTSSSEYSRLATSCAGQVNPTSQSCINRSTPVVFGTRIDFGADWANDENEMNRGFKVQSGYAKIQAVLWATDNNNARRNRAISYLQEYRSVTSFEQTGGSTGNQWRLVAGWSCTNLAQAAEIVNYQDDQFKRFLKDVCYPAMDWNGPNWHASFADSKLAIAAYLGDTALWADAKAYFYRRIAQSFYHSAYDGNKVNPVYRVTDPNRNPDLALTRAHWGGTWGPTHINSDYTLNTAVAPIVDGMNAEHLRDLGHVNMSFGAWFNGARTILAQGEQLEQHAYDRMLKGIEYHAPRVLAYIQTGVVPHPVPYGIDSETGPGQRFQAWYPARKFFGSDTPAAVHSLLQLPEIKNFAAGGTLHMVGEAFIDGP